MADRDVWHRPVTNTRHVDKKSGRLKHSALRIEGPEIIDSAWKSEISGRLRSVVRSLDEIRAEANLRVRIQKTARQSHGESGKEFEFIGVAHAATEKVRAWKVDNCDIKYDPRTNKKAGDFDLAHANLTFATKPPDGILSAIHDVLSELQFTPEAKLADLPQASCKPPWPHRVLASINQWL